jgi:hypothetical protein
MPRSRASRNSFDSRLDMASSIKADKKGPIYKSLKGIISILLPGMIYLSGLKLPEHLSWHGNLL